MLFPEQCQLARQMTNTFHSDKHIIDEYISLSNNYKNSSAKAVHELIKSYKQPFNKIFPVILQDFYQIAKEYNISPATLFCIYIEYKIIFDN